jgi:hypothetical protein
MKVRKAEQFEQALKRAAQGKDPGGEYSPLIQVVHRAKALADPPPPPPQDLLPGRQRVLKEAFRLRAGISKPGKERVRMSRSLRWVSVAVATLLIFGMIFGTGQAMAASLPGGPLYDFKLAAEEVRLALATAPVSEAELNWDLAQERLDEIEALVQKNRPIDEATAARVQQRLQEALKAAQSVEGEAGQQIQYQLAQNLQQRQQTMTQLMTQGAEPQNREQLQNIVRVMVQVRERAHAGAGDMQGVGERNEYGEPSEPPEEPGISRTPGPPEQPGAGEPGSAEPSGPAPGSPAQFGPGGQDADDQPGSGPQPWDTPPGEEPGGPKGPSDGDQPEPGPGEPQPTSGPGEPGGPNATGDQPGPGPGEPQPGDGPGEPSSPGPQATVTVTPAPNKGPGGSNNPNSTEPSSPGKGDPGTGNKH